MLLGVAHGVVHSQSCASCSIGKRAVREVHTGRGMSSTVNGNVFLPILCDR